MKNNPSDVEESKVKTRTGSGYLRQLYSNARVTAQSTSSHLKTLTSFLVNFIPVSSIDPSPLQVRKHFDPAEIESLAESIRKHGVLQPILVLQEGDRYQVIAGERRLRASQQAGLDRIPARVLPSKDLHTQEIALRENLDRLDLHPLEEGEGYHHLLESQAYPSHEALAKAFGKPKSRVTECLALTRLSAEVKEKLLSLRPAPRAFLRHLVTLPVAEQLGCIQKQLTLQAAGKEGGRVQGLKKIKKAALKNPSTPFSYQLKANHLKIEPFRWTPGNSPEVLRESIHQLRLLLKALEIEFPFY